MYTFARAGGRRRRFLGLHDLLGVGGDLRPDGREKHSRNEAHGLNVDCGAQPSSALTASHRPEGVQSLRQLLLFQTECHGGVGTIGYSQSKGLQGKVQRRPGEILDE
jgi:hypothetical protein